MIALAIVLAGGWHNSLRHALADLRFAWQSRAATGNVVVVAIDAPSIDQIGVWPWPRRLHAELLHRLEAAGAQDRFWEMTRGIYSSRRPPTRDSLHRLAVRLVSICRRSRNSPPSRPGKRKGRRRVRSIIIRTRTIIRFCR